MRRDTQQACRFPPLLFIQAVSASLARLKVEVCNTRVGIFLMCRLSSARPHLSSIIIIARGQSLNPLSYQGPNMRASQKRWLERQAAEPGISNDLGWAKRRSGRNGPGVMQLIPKTQITRLDHAITPRPKGIPGGPGAERSLAFGMNCRPIFFGPKESSC